jgi:hypothetical protein
MTQKVKKQSFLTYLWAFTHTKKVYGGSFIKARIQIRSQTPNLDLVQTRKVRIRLDLDPYPQHRSEDM